MLSILYGLSLGFISGVGIGSMLSLILIGMVFFVERK